MTTLAAEIAKFRKELDRLNSVVLNVLKLRKIKVVSKGYDENIESIYENGYFIEHKAEDTESIIEVIKQLGFKLHDDSGSFHYYTKNNKGEIVIDAEGCYLYITKSLIEDFMYPPEMDELEEYFSCPIREDAIKNCESFKRVCPQLYTAKYYNSIIYVTFYQKETRVNTRPSDKLFG